MLSLSRFLPRLMLSGLLLSAAALPAFSGEARVLVDMTTGTVLEQENADALNYPASLTKMMTLYLTFEALHNGRLTWDTRITMSENANGKEPFKFAIGAGKTVSVREAVTGMIVLSANDAAVAMGETLGGSEAGFGQMMTAKARAIGMGRTVFRNPAGLPDPDQVTTAADMARLGQALIHDFPEEYKLFSQKSMVFRGMKLRGHNGVLNTYAGADGIKTGYTEASGYNLVTSVARGGHRLVGVVLGGKTAQARDAQMKDMMDRHLPPADVAAKPKAPAKPVARKPATIHEAAIGKP
ncbi:D-alanyl-D-alanine carboxypeptidase (penicillin-binding protein 5/6) [Rhizobium sp. RU35A]|uniref:D-alanyl-D-alanine carboxypeptidase n=1 Tax=Rhizobium straminoryzae TaxID=1387186 RepID=A0A549T5W6_9HYPH|nr:MULTISPECIES: D-alanyl-D-alanine carboxypeptidase family protein [Rhizobium]TRL37246.1 D-alanyl-D-alanine carboxypeptidase [Rhizobium straminoryzae]SIQ16123.1 D-alanyl-D-alanine carboxypeptidase (penicillin-binding protein 5/6) [Rhizobium sp. RU35A]